MICGGSGGALAFFLSHSCGYQNIQYQKIMEGLRCPEREASNDRDLSFGSCEESPKKGIIPTESSVENKSNETYHLHT